MHFFIYWFVHEYGAKTDASIGAKYNQQSMQQTEAKHVSTNMKKEKHMCFRKAEQCKRKWFWGFRHLGGHEMHELVRLCDPQHKIELMP